MRHRKANKMINVEFYSNSYNRKSFCLIRIQTFSKFHCPYSTTKIFLLSLNLFIDFTILLRVEWRLDNAEIQFYLDHGVLMNFRLKFGYLCQTSCQKKLPIQCHNESIDYCKFYAKKELQFLDLFKAQEQTLAVSFL